MTALQAFPYGPADANDWVGAYILFFSSTHIIVLNSQSTYPIHRSTLIRSPLSPTLPIPLYPGSCTEWPLPDAPAVYAKQDLTPVHKLNFLTFSFKPDELSFALLYFLPVFPYKVVKGFVNISKVFVIFCFEFF